MTSIFYATLEEAEAESARLTAESGHPHSVLIDYGVFDGRGGYRVKPVHRRPEGWPRAWNWAPPA